MRVAKFSIFYKTNIRKRKGAVRLSVAKPLPMCGKGRENPKHSGRGGRILRFSVGGEKEKTLQAKVFSIILLTFAKTIIIYFKNIRL